ncbi:hypothetical protein L7F22_026454 [Adiantum nelumboides]|nr:hypothetical protein [Adiantum nelumboides]
MVNTKAGQVLWILFLENPAHPVPRRPYVPVGAYLPIQLAPTPESPSSQLVPPAVEPTPPQSPGAGTSLAYKRARLAQLFENGRISAAPPIFVQAVQQPPQPVVIDLASSPAITAIVPVVTMHAVSVVPPILKLSQPATGVMVTQVQMQAVLAVFQNVAQSWGQNTAELSRLRAENQSLRQQQEEMRTKQARAAAPAAEAKAEL